MATTVLSTHNKNSVSATATESLKLVLPSRTAMALLFASGASALIYEILWSRQLTLIVGIGVFAITTAISAFFLGLALGSYLWGRCADRLTRPVRLYAALELSVAFLSVGATLALARAEVPFARIEERIGILAWILPFALVALPAILMGGTLPVLVRACFPQKQDLSATGGNLYAANTAGGVLGALLSSFILIPHLGITSAAMVAAAVNLAAAVGALLAEGWLVPAVPEARAKPRRKASNGNPRLALVLYSIAGGIALGYEVVWTQAIVPFLSTRTFAFAVVLATYLTGLVIGSAMYAHFAKRVFDAGSLFAILIASAGLIALLEVTAVGRWLVILQTQAEYAVVYLTHSGLAGMCTRFAVAALTVVFVPTLLLGAAFPAVLSLAAGPEHSGGDVGAVVALNTAGGIVGTMLTGFVLVPWIGLAQTLSVLALCASAVGLVAVFRSTTATRGVRIVVLVIGAGACLCTVLIPPNYFAKMLITARGAGEVIFYEESSGGTVAVVQEQQRGESFRRLYIQGVSNSGDALPSLRYMREQALLPLMIHEGEAKSALVVGFGTGITSGALLCYEQLEQRVSAELLPAVVRAAPFFHGNFEANSNSKLEIRLRDGRRELVQSEQTYDLITLEPPPPSAAGVANLYSTDFYRLASKRLRPNGLLAQWLPIAAQNDEDSRSLVRSFLDVFPYATAWTTEMHEVLLVGSQSPIELDANRIRTRFNEPRVIAAMREVGIASPEALLATWLMGRSGLERYVRNAQPVTDDRPRIEYAKWVRPDEIIRVLPELLELRSDPPITAADPAFLEAMNHERARLLDYYAAGLAAYRGDRESWAANMRRVLNEQDSNPYYEWAMKGSSRNAGLE